MRSLYFHVLTHIQHFLITSISEYDPTKKIFSCAYPWLFPGGLGDVFDDKWGGLDDRPGPIQNLRSWAKHLMRYYDGRFQKDHLFGLYVHNFIQRHENNRSGAFFHSDKNWYGKNPPTVEELKHQIRNGDFTFISKLRYYSQNIKGSDGFWRNKGNELRAWVDYHVSQHHGPPTHFITLTCAENWWPDLQDIYADIEKHAGRNNEANAIRSGDRQAMSRAARRNPMYVNEYFMTRSKQFLDVFARDVLELEYYWGRVEFAPGRGAIHLHLLGIAKDKAYLRKFYAARTETQKVKALESYADEMLGMTADTAPDETYDKFDINNTSHSPLGRRFSDAQDMCKDHCHLAQDSVQHKCNDYCLGDMDKLGIKLRTCRFGSGTEETPNQGDTPGWEFRDDAVIEKNKKGVEHLLMRRTNSRRINQHSRHVLQAWRANADVQLLIYRSNPDVPDISEIEAVCRYCTSYASKAHQTTRQEIATIQDVIIG